MGPSKFDVVRTHYKINHFIFKIEPSFKFSRNSKFIDFEKAYGDKSLSFLDYPMMLMLLNKLI